MDAQAALARVGLTLDTPRRSPRASKTAEAEPPNAYLSDALAAFLAAVEAGNRSPRTLAMYQAAVRVFERWLAANQPGTSCADLNNELIDAYLRYLRHDYVSNRGGRLSDCSIRQYVLVLKIFANWGARGQRYWKVCPIADYDLPQFTEPEIVPHTREELVVLLNACGSPSTFAGRRLRAMLLVDLDTGMRRGELRKVSVEMLDLSTGRLRLPAAITKSRRPRTVHLQQSALTAVRAWLVARNALPGVAPDSGPLFCQLDGTPISDHAIQELGVRLGQRSGVTRFHWHLMRHTNGTESLRNGADSLDVQEALGHTTSTMTRRYLHLTDDDRRERHARYSPVQALLRKSEPREKRFSARRNTKS